jgi:hypothetical protein
MRTKTSISNRPRIEPIYCTFGPPSFIVPLSSRTRNGAADAAVVLAEAVQVGAPVLPTRHRELRTGATINAQAAALTAVAKHRGRQPTADQVQ